MGPHCWDTLAWPGRPAGAWHGPLALPPVLDTGQGHWHGPGAHGDSEPCPGSCRGRAVPSGHHSTTARVAAEVAPMAAARIGVGPWMWCPRTSVAPQHPQVPEGPQHPRIPSFREKGTPLAAEGGLGTVTAPGGLNLCQDPSPATAGHRVGPAKVVPTPWPRTRWQCQTTTPSPVSSATTWNPGGEALQSPLLVPPCPLSPRVAPATASAGLEAPLLVCNNHRMG